MFYLVFGTGFRNPFGNNLISLWHFLLFPNLPRLMVICWICRDCWPSASTATSGMHLLCSDTLCFFFVLGDGWSMLRPHGFYWWPIIMFLDWWNYITGNTFQLSDTHFNYPRHKLYYLGGGTFIFRDYFVSNITKILLRILWLWHIRHLISYSGTN